MAGVNYHDGKFPPKHIDWPRLLPLIGPANAGVARCDALLKGVPNSDVLLSPLASQEAVLSSRIEGTQATLGDVLQFEASEDTASGEKRNDILEVLNYRRALKVAVDRLATLPLSQRLILETHQVLMDGVRGQNKRPGQYRITPNWIGPPGCTPETARFVPPAAGSLADLMTGWERYLHADAPDILVQLAIIHAEFEAIHPFLDGNGRLGRLLVPLFMMSRGQLSSPCFYISAYFEAHRQEYYDRLLAVSRDDDWTGWCEFFLRAVIDQARDNEQKALSILHLFRAMRHDVAQWTHSHHAGQAIDWFFSRPIFKTPDFVASSGIPAATARRFVRVLTEQGMFVVLRPGSGRRADILAFRELLNITEGRDII
jgi:Fic family protein